jgi:hypothetical protein
MRYLILLTNCLFVIVLSAVGLFFDENDLYKNM